MPDHPTKSGDARDGALRESFAGARVLVTGGAGFIGSHLVRRLRGLGGRVRVIDDLSTGRFENLPADGVEFIEASIGDESALARAAADCAFVFHEAAMVSVPMSVESPVRCHEINVTGTERVLEASLAAGARRLVFASSCAVYGLTPQVPSRESDEIDCVSPYAASKAAGEALVSAFGRCYDINTVNLRYFNVYGPGQDPDSPYAAVIAAFHRALSDGRRPTIFGTGEQTRDFVHVDDVVQANLLAAICEPPPDGTVVNVGTGVSLDLREVLRHAADALGVEANAVHAPARPGDVMHSRADITRAKTRLGFAPSVDFATGISRMVEASALPPPVAPPLVPPLAPPRAPRSL